MSKIVEFKVSYNGGTAADGKLELYDAGRSLMGLSRAISITTHAFLNNGFVRTRADRVHGANVFLSGPRHGSFLEDVSVVFDEESEERVGRSVIVPAFYDFLKWTWRFASGKAPGEPETAFVRRMAERQEPLLGDMSTGLESALREFQRPLSTQHDMTISFIRPRTGELLRLDHDSLLYVTPEVDDEITENVIGNVTKYNMLSGIGRLYDDGEERTVSFDLAPGVSAWEKSLLTESMHERNRGNHGKIAVDVKRVFSARGVLKRYTLHAVRRIKEFDSGPRGGHPDMDQGTGSE